LIQQVSKVSLTDEERTIEEDDCDIAGEDTNKMDFEEYARCNNHVLWIMRHLVT
jgi:hypothetical protein